MKNLVIIKADYNDADYVYSISDMSNKDIEEFKNVVSKLDRGGDWSSPELDYQGILTEEEIEWINDLLPYTESPVHTICSIEVYEYTKKVEIF